jgi:hypothetical protein
MDITISNEQKISVRLNPLTGAGNPATIDGPAAFNVESGDATVEPDADGLGAFIVSGAVGASVIRVSADADLGDGVRTIDEVINLTVTNPEAVSLGLAAGTAEPK